MPTTPYTSVYDLEYFCLTNDNILLCRRKGIICQIKPSEFLEGDQLLSLTDKGDIIWTNAFLSKKKAKKDEKIVRIVSQRGTFYLTTGHKMFLENGELQAAGNLSIYDRLKYSNKFCLPSDESIGIDKAYVLGAYAAEGSSQEGTGNSGNGKWRLVWGLHYNEVLFATKIFSYIVSAFPGSNCRIEEYLEYTRRTVSSYDKNLVLMFKEIGALGLCHVKRVPPCIFRSKREEKAAFLAALIEGDGTFSPGVVTLKLTSKALIDGVHLLCEDLGINNKLNFFKTVNKDVYTLKIYGKENLKIFLSLTSRYLHGWKHLSSIQNYTDSNHGNIKHSKKDIQKALDQFYPARCDIFSEKSGIPQATIKRLFGSWNKCLKYFGYKPKNSRWGINHIPDNQFTRILDDNLNYFIEKNNKIIKIDFIDLAKETDVYDFHIPITENFLINTICSHNSGSEMFLYIGDVWVDEVTSLQYQVTQNKTPIYGYASQLWDDCAAGQVIVQGSFTINFKEQGYLWAVLRRYHNISGPETKIKTAKKDQALFSRKVDFNRPVKGSNVEKVKRQSIESITQGRATRGEVYKFYQGLAGYATTQVKNPRDQAFENIVEAFEDEIWNPKNTNMDLNTQLRRTDSNEFDNFDMYVVFGNYAAKGANHTVSKIIDVRLISQGKQIVIDGSPIQERYDFIAQTVA